MEVKRAEREEGHQDLRHREHDEGILLQELARDGTAYGQPEDERRKHLVKTVARRPHQEAQQANPHDFIDKRSEAGDARNPEPRGFRGHRKVMFRRVGQTHGKPWACCDKA